MSSSMIRPTVAVWKFASCDGCQLTLLDCERELLALASALDIRMFLEAGPEELLDHYDLSLVEGSITTAHDAERIRDVRARSGMLVTIGACATAGGVQALRNGQDVEAWVQLVYEHPEWVEALETSTPVAAHVPVDHELHGCPIAKSDLLDLITAVVAGRRPHITSHSVCAECKLADRPCLLVAHGTPCLGPVTHAGCGALCPALDRGCFGCFGPSESANLTSMRETLHRIGATHRSIDRSLATFNVGAPAFRDAIGRHDAREQQAEVSS